jgi:hypothetical protein
LAETFDLLGDPIPEGFGKRGRPPHIPTVENRNKIMMLLAMGWTDPRIAASIGVTPATLKKHYFRELKVRAEARHRLDGKYMFDVWTQASNGNVGAMRLFGQLLEKADLSQPKTPTQVVDDKTGKAAKLGKKEQADKDARTVSGTWGDVLPGTDGDMPN